MTVSERVASGASGCTQIRPTTLSTFGASREEKQECHWDSDQKKSMVELLPIRHILDIFAELVWKSRWRAQNLIVKHHVPMTEWQFWRWIMLDPLFQRQCSGSSMYHTWPTLGWFSEMFMMIWIYLDDLEHYHGRRNPDVTLHTLLFSVPLSSEPFGWVPAAGESNQGRSRFLHHIIGS